MNEHRQLWRRIRRRYGWGWWGLLIGAGSLIAPACILGWMLRDQGWGWLYLGMRCLWLPELAFGIGAAGLMLLLGRRAAVDPTAGFLRRTGWLVALQAVAA